VRNSHIKTVRKTYRSDHICNVVIAQDMKRKEKYGVLGPCEIGETFI